MSEGTLEIVEQGGATIVGLAGRLDSATVPGLESRFLAAIQPGRTTLYDAAGVVYVSAAGVRLVVAAARAAERVGGRMALCGLREDFAETLRVTGFDMFLSVHADRAAAFAALGTGGAAAR